MPNSNIHIFAKYCIHFGESIFCNIICFCMLFSLMPSFICLLYATLHTSLASETVLQNLKKCAFRRMAMFQLVFFVLGSTNGLSWTLYVKQMDFSPNPTSEETYLDFPPISGWNYVLRGLQLRLWLYLHLLLFSKATGSRAALQAQQFATSSLLCVKFC